VDILTGSATHIFTIINEGSDDLNISLGIGGANAADFSVTAAPSATVAAGGGTTTFSIKFDPSASGVRNAEISLINNDSDENPFNFAIRGTGTAVPEIDVTGNGVSIADGDTTPSTGDATNFGTVIALSDHKDHVFTIKNTGSASLSLSGNPRVEISGNNADQFSLISAPAATVAAGSETKFTIRFTPTSHGTKSATLSIPNSDSNENPYNFSIQGKGYENTAPSLDDTESPTLTAIDEDQFDSPGDSVATIVVDGSITDPDGAIEAIAVISVDNSNGKWQYSLNNGSNWNDFSAVTGSNVDMENEARLLDGTLSGAGIHKIRFVPAPNYYGKSTFSFRAWDRYTGTAGSTANASSTGWKRAYSTDSDTAEITVNSVNDLPLVSDVDKEGVANQTLQFVKTDFTSKFSDIDGDSLVKIKILSLPANGTLKLGPADDLAEDDEVNASFLIDLNFEPDLDWDGTTSFQWTASDGTDYALLSATVNILIKPDSDGDGTPDDEDQCDSDPDKIVPGLCGCGTADTDSDQDGTPDCDDNCPNDKDKIEPGSCGCGRPDSNNDTDNDGTIDCNDGCYLDINKVEPGLCGCGVADTDSDLDGTPDCNDSCPGDIDKIEPGLCGCGNVDSPDDTDGDGTIDCVDGCPGDIGKTAPGICGCGTSDIDSDSDGTPDCNDNCPNDINKLEPGLCGCGTTDTDSDSDGTPDCDDSCPADNSKTEPGLCGCGVVDSADDDDLDGVLNCNDICPGFDDTKDADSDGTPDGCDADYDGSCTNPIVVSLPYKEAHTTEARESILDSYGNDCNGNDQQKPDIVFSVELKAGDEIEITLTPEASFDAELRLLDQCAEDQVCLSVSDSNGIAVYEAATDMTLFVVVEGTGDPASGSFEIEMRLLGEESDADSLLVDDDDEVDAEEEPETEPLDEDLEPDGDDMPADEDETVSDEDDSTFQEVDEEQPDGTDRATGDGKDSDYDSGVHVISEGGGEDGVDDSGCSCSVVGF